MLTRRLLTGSIGAAGLSGLFSHASHAQSVRSLRILIPSGPGGGWDLTGRAVGAALQAEGLVRSTQITNVAGAGGVVGLAHFVNQNRGRADALMVAGLVMVTNIASANSPLNLAMTTPIARLSGEFEVVAVPADSPYRDLPGLMSALRKDPASISWVGGTAGGTDHIVAAMLARAAGVDPRAISYVGFAGGGQIQAALLGKHVHAGVSGWSEFSEHAKRGSMRILGITAKDRLPGVEVPTMLELGYDVQLVNWRGMFGAPKITAPEALSLREMIEALTRTESWQQELRKREWTPLPLFGDDFSLYLAAESTRIVTVLKELGLA